MFTATGRDAVPLSDDRWTVQTGILKKSILFAPTDGPPTSFFEVFATQTHKHLFNFSAERLISNLKSCQKRKQNSVCVTFSSAFLLRHTSSLTDPNEFTIINYSIFKHIAWSGEAPAENTAAGWDECLPQVNARTEMHLRASDLTVWQHLHPICPNWKGWDECVLQVNSANRYFTQSDPRTGRTGEISSVCFPNPCYRTEVSERDPQIYEQIH
eukprot:g20407.t1